MAHITGSAGDIVGVLFRDALYAPPRPNLNNKILWIARPVEPPTTTPVGNSRDLKIRAALVDSDVSVERTVPGGPGPSIVDLPRAGCWTVEASWSGHRDELQIPYRN